MEPLNYMGSIFEGAPPEPPKTVTCSPCCGLDVTGTEMSDDETVAQCPGCKRIVEGCTVEVPVSVYESGVETVMAWIQAHQGREERMRQ